MRKENGMARVEMARVEVAFRRMDRNRDGFIDWDEFLQVNLSHT